jgi:hypothetical protein
LIALLATRTGKLDDVLAAERELARVREDMETLEGRRRFLAASVERGTLRVDFVTGDVVAGLVAPGLFRDAARQGAASFLWLIALIVRISGVLVPLLAAALAGWGAWKRWGPRPARVLPILR